MTSDDRTGPTVIAPAAVDLSGGGAAIPGDGRRGPDAIAGWSLVVCACLLSMMISVVVVFFLPLRWGPVPVPISALVAFAALLALPRVCFALTGRLSAAIAPNAVWLLLTGWLSIASNPLYPQLPLATVDWRMVLLLGGGGLCAAVSIGLLWGRQTQARRPVK